jgi:predicted TIM-barrel fold metal-dependent hydrolase
VRIIGRNLDHPEVFPLYELAQELDIPVTIHAGGGRFTAELFVDQYPLAQACGFAFDIMFGCASLLGGGVLERFPRLRVSFLEAGATWLPYFLDRLDERYERRRSELPGLRRKPSEYLEGGRLLVSCEPGESMLGQVAARLGADKILYASDYPHWDADFPDSVREIRERADLGDADKRAILGDNARRFLRL